MKAMPVLNDDAHFAPVPLAYNYNSQPIRYNQPVYYYYQGRNKRSPKAVRRRGVATITESLFSYLRHVLKFHLNSMIVKWFFGTNARTLFGNFYRGSRVYLFAVKSRRNNFRITTIFKFYNTEYKPKFFKK